jgi:hypothetical protein
MKIMISSGYLKVFKILISLSSPSVDEVSMKSICIDGSDAYFML